MWALGSTLSLKTAGKRTRYLQALIGLRKDIICHLKCQGNKHTVYFFPNEIQAWWRMRIFLIFGYLDGVSRKAEFNSEVQSKGHSDSGFSSPWKSPLPSFRTNLRHGSLGTIAMSSKEKAFCWDTRPLVPVWLET